MIRVAFLDRDGTLIHEPPETHQVNGVEQLQILPNVTHSLLNMIIKGYWLVMITNQDGLGMPCNPLPNFETVQAELFRRLRFSSISFSRVFICPHFPDNGCLCRKPRTGMVEHFLRSHEIDLSESFVVGDRDTDGEFARNVGVHFYRMQTNGCFPEINLA